jgi:peptidoglycan/LPS O-acetylase OafA/YrhL
VSVGHVPALDGLRGIAILLVMAVHFIILEPRPGVENGIKHLTDGGWMGVDLFFVLSGFLISGILVDAKGSPTFFRSFYGRRVLRIFPLYYLYLAFVLLLVPILLPGWAASIHSQSPLWFWGYSVNFLVAHTGDWPTVPTTARLWSLAIEEQFYLLWPLLVFALDRRQLLRTAGAVIVLTPVLRAVLLMRHVLPVAVFVLLWTRWDALMAGAFVALAVRSETGQRLLRRYGTPVAVMAAMALMAAAAYGRGLSQYKPAMQTLGFSAIAVLSAAAIVRALDPASRLAGLLSVRWLRSIGRYAYALYLFHGWAMWLVSRTGLRSDHPPALLGQPILGSLVIALVAGCLAYLMAWASWRAFEEPILRLKRYLPYDRPLRTPQLREAV